MSDELGITWVEVRPWPCARDGICEDTGTQECSHAKWMPDVCLHGCVEGGGRCIHQTPSLTMERPREH